MMIFYFDLVHFTFSISYSLLPIHLVYGLQFLHLIFLILFLKPLSSVIEKTLDKGLRNIYIGLHLWLSW